ncbi:MAG: PD-(D/E)XK nuclease family protein [Bryobacteraceae bacterium]
MTTETETIRLVTHSQFACARACLRKHYLCYTIGLRPIQSQKPLRFGDNFHIGLEVLKTGATRDEAIEAGCAGYEIPPAWADPVEWRVEEATVAAMIAGHSWRYGEDKLEYLSAEQVFEMDLVNPETGRPSRTWKVAGKIDGIVKCPDGRIAVMEYKTTSEDIGPESDYWLRLRCDPQISLYVLAARKLGFPVDFVLYDVSRKPSIAPKLIPEVDDQGRKIVVDGQGTRVFKKDGSPRESASTADGYVLKQRRETPEEFGQRLIADIGERPDFYYARREIPRLDHDLEEFEHELWQQGQMLRQCELTGRWFRNVGRGCGFCAYKSLCLNGVEVDPSSPPAGFEVVENVHQELVEE